MSINFLRPAGFHLLLPQSLTLRRVEMTIVAIVFAMLLAAGTAFVLITVNLHQSDTAMFLDVVEGTLRYGLPLTRTNGAITEAIWSWSASSIEQVCNGNLLPPQYDNAAMQINQFTRHAYLIVYPLSLLTLVAPAIDSMPFAHVTAFLAVIIIAYLVLRRHAIPILPSVLMCLLITAHPVWSYGLASGNFYADRFFLAFGLLYLVLLQEVIVFRRPAGWLVLIALFASAIFAASTTERGAFMVAAATFGCVVLYPRQFLSHRLTPALLIVGAVCLAWYLGYVRWITTNPDNVSFIGTISAFPDLISSPRYLHGTLKFILINFAIVAPLLIWNWRLALLLFGATVPNLFMTIGGAERVGFVTHYHSFYFPFLVVAVLYGFIALWSKAKLRWQRTAAVCGCLGLCLILGGFSSNDDEITFSKRNMLDWAPWRMAESLWLGDRSSEWVLANQRLKAAAEVPPGASVTTFEGMMPTLFHDRFLYYYPMGIEIADYAVLSVDKTQDGQRYFSGAIAYNVDRARLDQCLTERLGRAGYDLENAKTVGSIAVLKRIPR